MTGIEPKDIVLTYYRCEPGDDLISEYAMVQGQTRAVPICHLTHEQALNRLADLIQCILETSR